MGEDEAFQADWELDVAATHHILDLEVEEFRLDEPKTFKIILEWMGQIQINNLQQSRASE